MTDQFKPSPDSGKSEAEPPGAHQVGYKKPPRHTQFQKGISGNPAGRRKRDGNLRRYLNNFMDEAQATSNEVQMSRREAFVRTLIESARRGKTRAFKIFLQLPPCFGAQNTKTVLDIVVRDALDEAR
jgi:hypothetical protein